METFVIMQNKHRRLDIKKCKIQNDNKHSAHCYYQNIIDFADPHINSQQ